MKIDKEAIAKISYEAMRAFNQHVLGDYKQKSWDSLSDDLKNDHLVRVEYRLRDPHSLPSSIHDSWLADKLYRGWKYGEVIDENKKIHPKIVPWSKLSESERARDLLFAKIVDVLRG